MCLTTGNKNQQEQSMIWMLSNMLTNKDTKKHMSCNDFSMNQFSENIDQNGLVFSDENTCHQNNISNHMSNYYERDLTQTGIMNQSNFLMNSNVNGFHPINVINQVRNHFCQIRLKVLRRFIC